MNGFPYTSLPDYSISGMQEAGVGDSIDHLEMPLINFVHVPLAFAVTPPDAKAIIAGPTDLYVKVGSVITLTCHVKQPASAAQDIGPIYWYRGPYILTPFVAHPNDAAIDLQRISMESTLAEKLQSR